MDALKVSKLLSTLEPSATLAINSKVQALKQSGREVLNFSIGEPDFSTPPRILAAAESAMRSGQTRYTEERGIFGLRQAIVERLALDYGVRWHPDEVSVSNGGKHALYNLFQALLDPGDEVIVPVPYWLSYPAQIRLAAGVPVFLPLASENGFQLDESLLEAYVTPHTRAIVINSPSNPSGVALSDDALRAVAAVALKHGLAIVSDDLYYGLTYKPAVFRSIVSLVPEAKAQTFVVGGVSKAYAMTGWRIGWCIGPRPILSAMNGFQGQVTSNPCSISQHAAIEALKVGPKEGELAGMIEEYAARRMLLLHGIERIPGISCVLPQGAFYVFPRVDAYFGLKTPEGMTIDSASTLAAWLVESAGVATVPGGVFGDDRHLRLSYATSVEILSRGIERLSEALARLR